MGLRLPAHERNHSPANRCVKWGTLAAFWCSVVPRAGATNPGFPRLSTGQKAVLSVSQSARPGTRFGNVTRCTLRCRVRRKRQGQQAARPSLASQCFAFLSTCRYSDRMRNATYAFTTRIGMTDIMTTIMITKRVPVGARVSA